MMSSFRPDPTTARRGFVPDRFEAGAPGGADFVGAMAEAGASSSIAASVDPSRVEPTRPEPTVVWTDDRVEALEREAFERGVASSRKQSEALERACAALEAGAAGLRRTSHARLLAHRELMLDLASEIATAWVGRELALDRELLGRALDQALEGVRSLEPDRLLLSVEDAASLLEAAEERVEHWRTEHRLELVEEPSLQPGEFRIEARQGSIDGRLESVRTRLREGLAEALSETLAEDPGEQTARVDRDRPGGSGA